MFTVSWAQVPWGLHGLGSHTSAFIQLGHYYQTRWCYLYKKKCLINTETVIHKFLWIATNVNAYWLYIPFLKIYTQQYRLNISHLNVIPAPVDYENCLDTVFNYIALDLHLMFYYESTTVTGLAGRSTPSCVTRTRVAVYVLCILCASAMRATWIWVTHASYVANYDHKMALCDYTSPWQYFINSLLIKSRRQ